MIKQRKRYGEIVTCEVMIPAGGTGKIGSNFGIGIPEKSVLIFSKLEKRFQRFFFSFFSIPTRVQKNRVPAYFEILKLSFLRIGSSVIWLHRNSTVSSSGLFALFERVDFPIRRLLLKNGGEEMNVYGGMQKDEPEEWPEVERIIENR
ncbi:hypothetical protein RCL_jg6835.t1 [Rhizophagus clarus]|uniref:Uncharacterized protein n=1 Tax=Rhizophagus clarus TaxID=94130 RepID=A0A8H3QPH7_9GLOM|nr:hypothetical protein RCL_jg6835.t1 [Rhizophagus clarus]